MSWSRRNNGACNFRPLADRRFVFVRHARAREFRFGRAREIVKSVAPIATAREFCVRQTRAAEIELVGADAERREKIMRAGGSDNVVLIDAVTADTNRADKDAVTIKWETTGKDSNSVG